MALNKCQKIVMNGYGIPNYFVKFVIRTTFSMSRFSKIAFILTLFSCVSLWATADRGGFGRKRSKVHLNITNLGTLRNSINFTLRSGINYKGSTYLGNHQVGNTIYANTLISYKKGNTVYILPYKHKVLMPQYSAQTGSKLIIRRK